MPILTALKVQNLRCLADTGFIDLKPITILVGRNSSGKSTFARVLPLLRQSVEESKRAPILWFGPYVDFGSIAEARRDSASSEPIAFVFRVSLQRARDIRRMTGFVPHHFAHTPEIHDVEVSLQLTSKSNSEVTSVAEIRLALFGRDCAISFASENEVSQITVGEFVWKPPQRDMQRITFRKLFPTIEFLREATVEMNGQKQQVRLPYDPLEEELQREVGTYVHGNTNVDTMAGIANNLHVGYDHTIFDGLAGVSGAPASWYSNVAALSIDGHKFKRLRDRIFAAALFGYLRTIDQRLESFFAGVRYLDPMRATAERYYRRRELAIDELDSKGSNVPFYLESLSPLERKGFEEWMERFFGVSIYAHNESGHISLKLREGQDSQPRNLADIGVGFSQLLPIALQLWALTRRRRRIGALVRSRVATSIVVEQPELHLHPEFQARLADVLVGCVEKDEAGSRLDVAMVVETHSASLINRLGMLVADQKISPEDVQVVLFEKEKGSPSSSVRVVQFDSSGVLTDWPFGFFEP